MHMKGSNTIFTAKILYYKLKQHDKNLMSSLYPCPVTISTQNLGTPEFTLHRGDTRSMQGLAKIISTFTSQRETKWGFVYIKTSETGSVSQETERKYQWNPRISMVSRQTHIETYRNVRNVLIELYRHLLQMSNNDFSTQSQILWTVVLCSNYEKCFPG